MDKQTQENEPARRKPGGFFVAFHLLHRRSGPAAGGWASLVGHMPGALPGPGV